MRNFPMQNTPTNISPAWGNPNQNLIRPRRETESARQLSCDVVFGSPSADCMGTGVCRITARTGGNQSASERKRSCRSTVGLFFPIEAGEGVSMVLTRALLCIQLYKTHLRHGTLTLESPCQLPRHIAKALGLKIRALPIGKYPVQENEGFLRIDFKVLTTSSIK
ncbi:MAG: hypothetical protein H7246_12250 [Phycisphaerae bacterium]|nr:hypothetical protein [Saprospiraceae bacterium]